MFWYLSFFGGIALFAPPSIAAIPCSRSGRGWASSSTPRNLILAIVAARHFVTCAAAPDDLPVTRRLEPTARSTRVGSCPPARLCLGVAGSDSSGPTETRYAEIAREMLASGDCSFRGSMAIRFPQAAAAYWSARRHGAPRGVNEWGEVGCRARAGFVIWCTRALARPADGSWHRRALAPSFPSRPSSSSFSSHMLAKRLFLAPRCRGFYADRAKAAHASALWPFVALGVGSWRRARVFVLTVAPVLLASAWAPGRLACASPRRLARMARVRGGRHCPGI